MSSFNVQIVQLTRKLTDQTRAGAINWKEVDTATFEARLPSGIVRVGSVDKDGAEPHGFFVYGPSGGLPLETSYSRVNPAISELYDVVRRQALGVDAVVEGLLRDVTDAGEGADDDLPL